MIEIHEVDPADEAALRAWWEVGHAASAERPYDGWPAWEVSRRALPEARDDGHKVLLLATDGDQAVGSALLWWPLLDNLHAVDLDVYVVPEHRRAGVGTAVLAECEARVRGTGRPVVMGTVYAPPGQDGPGSLFASARGYPVAIAEESKLLDLDACSHRWGLLDEEVATALGASGGYGLDVVVGAVPDEWVDDMVALLSQFLAMIPTGDLDLENESWTRERLRDAEARREARGAVAVTAVATTPEGRLCGFSDVVVNRHSPDLASVGGTLVTPEHRGHRLGLGMKLLTHRRLMEVEPGCERVETGNAGVNAAMNAVNELMGYRVVERALDVQKRL